MSFEESNAEDKFPLLKVSVKATRWPDYYVYNVWVPNFLLSMLAFTSYGFSRNELAARLSIVMAGVEIDRVSSTRTGLAL